jgi:hypothetical protein
MRQNLNDDDLAGKILLHGIKKTPIGIDPTLALHAVLVDDDSGVNGNGDDDISNGSPNYETINAAFRKHGLATDNVAYVEIDWRGSAPADVADTEDLDIAVTVDEGAFTIESVQLRYRVNAGTGSPVSWEDPVTMTYDGGGGFYHHTIDDAEYSLGDVIDFYVRVQTDDTNKEFTCFPTQAQWDWTAPNGDNIPEERDFFSVLVTNSARIPALSTDLQTDPSWTVGTDQWEWGAPNLADFGEQPGNDYRFDDDGAGPSPYCYFTSNDFSVDGEWELTTTAFDLDTEPEDPAYAVISYALWFYARLAEVDDEKFEVHLYGNDSTWYTIQTIDVDESGEDDKDTKRVRWIRQRLKVKNGTGQGEVPFGSSMKLRFRATEASATVESVIDEVRVWGVYE